MLKIENWKIKNYMEDLVEQNVDAILDGQGDVCQCDRCRSDVIALTLNSLPPRYVATDSGETYAKIQMLDLQFRADIFIAISQAAGIVKNNPRHG